VALGDFGEVLVLDWGLAKVVGGTEEPGSRLPVAPAAGESGDLTQQGQVLGTPAYMAPEQAEGRLDRVDWRTDVYGLGAILYEILAGRAPFAGADAQELTRNVIQELPTPPSTFVPGTPLALDAVCLKALAKKPAERYGSAAEVASEVRCYLADEPVSAYRDPPVARIGRWARRRRTLVTGLAAAALVAVVSLTVATVLLSAANRRESEARLLAQQRGEEAARETAKARANFQLARDAVEEYCTKVSEDPRLKEKDLEELRKGLLQSAIKFHQKFVEQHGDDPALRADLGRAYRDLGRLLGDTGDRNRAVEFCRQAIAIQQQLIAEHADAGPYRVQLAQSLADLGRLLDFNAQTAEARAAFEEALRVLDADRQDGPSPLLRREYVRTCNHLAFLLYYKVGAQEEAIGSYRRAVAFLEREQTGVPDDWEDRHAQALLYVQLGSTLSDAGRPKEGLAWSEKAFPLLQRPAGDTSRPIDWVYALAMAYNNNGRVLTRLAQPDRAVEAYRKAVDLDLELVARHSSDSRYQHNLGADYNSLAMELIHAGQKQEGLMVLQRSLEAKEQLAARRPEVPDYRANLARGLFNLAEQSANRDEALGHVRRGLKLAQELTDQHADVAQYRAALGRGHHVHALLHARARQWDEALAAEGQAVQLAEQLVQGTDVRNYRGELEHYLLTLADFSRQAGRPDGALTAYRRVIALNPNNAAAHYRLGTVLMNRGQLDDAVASLDRALARKPEFAEAHCNRGLCLLRKGQFPAGRAALQRGDELGRKQPGWPYPSAEWVQHADRLIQLNSRLPAILAGEDRPADASEELALADMCRENKRMYTAATRFYAEAFAANASPANERYAVARYQAACAAALAAAGKDEAMPRPPDKVVVMLRWRALRWLRGELARSSGVLGRDEAKPRQAVRQRLARWLDDADLVSVRDAGALDTLPEAERHRWRQLWDDVAALLNKVDKKK
jgi:tetratricopeptide (TPR) repeat protein